MNPLVHVEHRFDAVVEVLPAGTRAIIRHREGDGSLWVVAGKVIHSSGNTRHIQPDGQGEVPIDFAAFVDTPETYVDPQKAAHTGAPT